MHKVVVNPTPLIALCHVGKRDVLQKLYGEVVILEAIYKEVLVKEDSICKKTVDMALERICVSKIKIKNKMPKEMYKSQLHEGEVEVMILAKEINAETVIIDDANAKYLKEIKKVSEEKKLTALTAKMGMPLLVFPISCFDMV